MSVEGRRQLLGILRHYGHGLRAQFRGAGSCIGLLLSLGFALHLGSLGTRGLGVPATEGMFLIGASPLDFRRHFTRVIVGLTFQVVPFLALTFFASTAGILFSPNQRREMLSLSAWPIRPGGLALMKLLDGHFWVMFAVVLAVPGILRGLAWVQSLDAALWLAALVALYLGLVLSAYFLGFTFMALGASLYARGLRRPPSLTVFVPSWISLGLIPAGLLLFPEWTGLPPLIMAHQGAQVAILMLLDARNGALIIILFWLLAIYAGFRLAWSVVGWGYVSVIDRFEVAGAAKQPASPALGGDGLGFRLLSPPVGAILRKDLRILSRHPVILITALTTLILSAAFLRPLFAGGANPALWTVFASTGPILLQVAYHELMTMEGPGGEHLLAFPATARDIMVGKILCAFLLNLPFPALGLAMMSLDGLRTDDLAFVLLWVTWLPCVIVAQLAIAGLFARRKATRVSESRASLSVYVGFPVQIPFAVAFILFAILAESEPRLALVGAGFHLLLAFAVLRFSTGVLHLMGR